MNIKFTACVLIENEFGEFICVSRKDDHTQFGLAGGKAELNETPIQTAIRETFEETGINIKENDLTFIYESNREGYKAYSFYIRVNKSSIIINHNEPHIVKWGNKKDLLDGPFGDYNKKMFEKLNN